MTIRSFTKRSFARNYPNKLKDAFPAQEGVVAQWPFWRGTACPYRNPSWKESSPRSGTFVLKVIARQESRRASRERTGPSWPLKIKRLFIRLNRLTASRQDSSQLWYLISY